MFGIGISELVLIVIVALIVVGPKNLPIALRAVGRAIGEFKRAMRELRNEVGLDEVVNEVARPLREGMAGVERDMADLRKDVLHDDELPHDDGGGAEYPEGGPDDYSALPETAAVYPEDEAPAYADAPALEGRVARGHGAPEDD